MAWFFGSGSKEALIRDIYHRELNRDADDEGIQYWMAKERPVTELLSFLSDPDNLEKAILDAKAEHLGQIVDQDVQDAYIEEGGIYTDPHEGGYADLDWRPYEQGDEENPAGSGITPVQKPEDFDELTYDFGHKDDDWSDTESGVNMHKDFEIDAVGEYSDGTNLTGTAKDVHDIQQGITTLPEVIDEIEQQGDISDIHGLYEVDDAEGGSDIGYNAPLEVTDQYMDATEEEKIELATELGENKWEPVTSELIKAPGDGWKDVTFPEGAGGVMYTPGFEKDEKGINTNTLSNKYEVPVPPDYTPPAKANVTREDVNYTPTIDGAVPNRPLKQLDSSYTLSPQQSIRKQSKFIPGASAKGVRRKQSKVAKSGRSALGTKQLGRENLKIKSLNI